MMNKDPRYKEYDVALVERDTETDELVLVLSKEVIERLGWEIGDTLNWSDNGNNTWTLSKKSI